MSVVSEKDYKKLADAIAEDFVTQQIPLNDSVQKLAADFDMNQDQICRLCEATNNATFTRLFQEKAKTASDRIVEFDVADPKVILSQQVKHASAHTYSAQALDAREYRELDDEMYFLRKPEPEYSQEKVAFELRPERKEPLEVDHRTVDKVIDNLRHKKIAADLDYMDAMKDLRNRFRRIYDVTPFDQFEKEAVALYRDAAVGIFSELRIDMGKPEVTYNYDALTKHALYVDDQTVEMQLLKRAMDLSDLRNKLDAALKRMGNL